MHVELWKIATVLRWLGPILVTILGLLLAALWLHISPQQLLWAPVCTSHSGHLTFQCSKYMR